LLKGLGFLDENGSPTERYFAFLDHSQSRRVLAEALREGYDELFALNKNAQKLSLDEVKGKLKSLTQGQKSDTVIGWMANTSRACRNWPTGLRLRRCLNTKNRSQLPNSRYQCRRAQGPPGANWSSITTFS